MLKEFLNIQHTLLFDPYSQHYRRHGQASSYLPHSMQVRLQGAFHLHHRLLSLKGGYEFDKRHNILSKTKRGGGGGEREYQSPSFNSWRFITHSLLLICTRESLRLPEPPWYT